MGEGEAARRARKTEAQLKAGKAAREAAPKERGGADVVLTISDRNHLRRAMNLCVGLFYIIREMPGAILLGRFGTHSIESHFGIVRSALRGQAQWRYWLGAEAYASLVVRMKHVLGLRVRSRAGRIPISGGVVAAMGEEDETTITPLPWTASNSVERRRLLEAATRSVEGDQDALSELYEYTLALIEHLKERPIRVDSGPSPQAGMVSAGRYSRPAPVWNRQLPEWPRRRWPLEILMARKSLDGRTGCGAIPTDPRFKFGSFGETLSCNHII